MMYLIQDTRTCVGNCASFWRPKSQGYTCNVEEAGRYTKEEAESITNSTEHHVMHEESAVLAAIVQHVRVDSNDNRFGLRRRRSK
jgi:hypothetical protein